MLTLLNGALISSLPEFTDVSNRELVSQHKKTVPTSFSKSYMYGKRTLETSFKTHAAQETFFFLQVLKDVSGKNLSSPT